MTTAFTENIAFRATASPLRARLAARRALEAEGIEFLQNANGLGVRLRRPP
jgi:hypothetical protein